MGAVVGRQKLHAVIAMAAVVAALLAPGAAAATRPGVAALPPISPTPQVLERHEGRDLPVPPRVTLVAGDEVDAPTLEVVEDVLTAAGARVVRSDRPRGPMTAWVGQPDENPAVAEGLDRMGVAFPADLPPEGYVLTSGRGRGGAGVVLAGADGDGTFYAAQTLRQLVVPGPGRRHDVLPSVTITDFPDLPLRGTIEGFYGEPWSHEDRLSQLAFYGEHKLNQYSYAPKDDPYHRERWRDPYPAEDLARIQSLVDEAQRQHVDFLFTISPGVTICYSRESEFAALVAKADAIWDLGVRDFGILLDDIDPTLRCAEDQAAFGDDPNPPAAAQAALLNRFAEEFLAPREGAGRPVTVPTHYSQAGTTPYRERFAQLVDPSVIVYWTGIGVVAPTITRADAALTSGIFGDKDLLIWDNYPVNDFDPSRLFLGPLVGREPGLGDHGVVGLHANPMNQAEASKIALATVADYAWNDDAYDPEASWERSLASFADDDPIATDALRTFAANSRTSQLDPEGASVLAPLVERFSAALASGDSLDGAAADLDAALAELGAAPATVRERIDNPDFIDEVEPWLAVSEHLAAAGRAAVATVEAQLAGDAEAAWRSRLALEQAGKTVAASPARMAPGVLDPLLAQVRTASDAWLGTPPGLQPFSSMGQYQAFGLDAMTDGDDATLYWSGEAVAADDVVGVDLGDVRQVSRIEVRMGSASAPADVVEQGVVEVSEDGSTWQVVGQATGERDVVVDLPAPVAASQVRLRATAAQGPWLQVREFAVTTADATGGTVEAVPAGTPAGLAAAAADGIATTRYVAASAPAAGDALTVTFPAPRPVDGVLVLQDPDAPAAGRVEVEVDGAWTALGPLTGGATELAVDGATAGALRIVWDGGGPAPQVAEVVAWTDQPITVAVQPSPVIAETGGESVEVGVAVSSGSFAPVAADVAVTGPVGWTVDPAERSVTVPRGTTITIPFALAAGAGAADGQVRAAVGAGGANVTAEAPARAVPPVTWDYVNDLARTGIATASSVEQDLPQFAPEAAVDGDPQTRWASGYDDDAWLQVELAEPARVGRAVLRWEGAYGEAYELQVSADGMDWTTVATVTDGTGGVDDLRFDTFDPVRFVRLQGVRRGTEFGYSLYTLELYGAAPSG